MVLSLLSCDTAPETGDIPQMSAVEWIERASLDLRGVRPTTEEIERVEADEAAAEALIEDFLQDGRFEGRVRDLWAEIYLTRTESYLIAGSAYGLDDASFQASLGEEALRMVGHVAAADLPWTELVTGDWTMADELLAAAWPLDYQGSGWQLAHYTDGRPAAGVLATNGIWWRYTSTESNANRKRAKWLSA